MRAGSFNLPPADGHFIAERMVRKFKTYSSKMQFTRAFADFPASVQLGVTGDACMHPGEVPALLYFRAEDTWVLLTSLRVVYTTETGVLCTFLTRVQTVEAPGRFKAPGYDLLVLVMDAWRRPEIHVEPGAAHIAFWNSLLVGLRILSRPPASTQSPADGEAKKTP